MDRLSVMLMPVLFMNDRPAGGGRNISICKAGEKETRYRKAFISDNQRKSVKNRLTIRVQMFTITLDVEGK